MTNAKATTMITILDEKMNHERCTAKKHINLSETAEKGVKECHLRVADYHLGVAHGLEIAKELIIQNMKN